MNTRKYAQSPRMFDSDFLDALSRCHPIVVPILYGPGAAILLALGFSKAHLSLGWASLWFGLGFVLWTLAEYWLHRWLFHWPASSALGKQLHFWLHGVHHRWPSDKYRLVMPPGASIPLYFAFLCVFLLVLGARGWAFHAGFVSGYAFYDLTHFWLHHGKPRSAYGRRLRRHHLLHHFKDSNTRFGVSNLVWDSVFASNGPPSRSGWLRRDTKRIAGLTALLVGLAFEHRAFAQSSTVSTTLSPVGSSSAPRAASLWQPNWPEFSTTEAILTVAAAVGTGVIVLVGPTHHPRWRSGILFDNGVRDDLRAKDPQTRRDFQNVGNYTYRLSPLVPLPDVLVVSAILHRESSLRERRHRRHRSGVRYRLRRASPASLLARGQVSCRGSRPDLRRQLHQRERVFLNSSRGLLGMPISRPRESQSGSHQ